MNHPVSTKEIAMSNAVTLFKFDSQDVRVVADEHGEPWFVGKDVCEALGYKNPNDAMNDHCRGVAKRYPISDSLGRMQDTRVLSEPDVMRLMTSSTLPAAQAFERLVFEDILPTIRKTGSYTVKPAAEKPTAIPPSKEFRALFGIARLIGLDKNAAAIAANQGVVKLTGTNVLQLMGTTHLEAANQETQWFTPTELGQRIQTSARGFNLLLAEAGLQMKRGDVWEVTEAGKEFARLYDTGKKHGSGVPIQQIKWSPAVLPLLGAEKEAA